MRIRKNAKVEGGSSVAMVCHLNQSPWDLIPFGSHPIHQFEYGGDDSFPANANNNGSAANPVGQPLHSVASPPQVKSPLNVDKDDNQLDLQKVVVEDKKKCKNNNNNNEEAKKKQVEEGDSTLLISSMRRRRRSNKGPRNSNSNRRRKPPSSSSKPNEFHYYSGFGLLWGNHTSYNHQKQQEEVVVKPKKGCPLAQQHSTITTQPNAASSIIIHTPPSSSSLHIHAPGVFHSDDEQVAVEEDYVVQGGAKKRMRKPVKARSLKSLM